MDCLFCKIASKEIKSEIVYENANVVAFKDIRPQAAVHLLLIHRTHTENVSSTTSDNSHIFADLFLAAKEIADLQGFTKDGYRIIINSGGCSMQEVYHTHLHLLSDKTSLGPLLA